MSKTLLLHKLQTMDPDGTLHPYEVSEYQLNRYAEYKFSVEPRVRGTITEEEFQQCPSKGIDREDDGFYVFPGSGGAFYVEVENKQVMSIAGYYSSEGEVFKYLEEEYGEQIQRAYDAQRSGNQQVPEIQGRDSQTPEDNKLDPGMAVQSNQTPHSPG